MSFRKEKLEELIKRIVSELLIREIKDPRIGFVSLTGVALSSDYTLARIGVSVLGDEKQTRRAMDGLKAATGFIQRKVGKEVRIRTTPRIEFYFDSSLTEGIDMVNLLDTLEQKERRDDPPRAGDDDGEKEKA